MAAIVLQKYDPWQNIGTLAGMHLGGVLGQDQQKGLAAAYDQMLNGQPAQQPTVQDTQNTDGLWSNQLRNSAQNSWIGQQQAAQQAAQPVATQQAVQPIEPVGQQAIPNANTAQSLWGFNGADTFNQQPTLYDEYLKKKEPTQSTQPITSSNALPNKVTIRSQSNKALGENIRALVKSGFKFDEALKLATQQQANDINDTYTQQISQYSDNVLEPMRQDIMNNLIYTTDKDGNSVVDTYNSTRVKGLMPAIARYNYLAGRAGLQTIDVNNINSIAALNKPNMKYEKMGNGQFLGINGDTGAITDMGNYGAKTFKVTPNGMGVMTGADGSIVNTGANYGKKGITTLPDGTTYMVDQNGNMQYMGVHAEPVSAGRTGTSGVETQKMKAITSGHTAWVKAHPGEDESGSPYYQQFRQVLGMGGNSGTSSPTKEPTYSSNEQDAIAKRIDQLHEQGYTKEQIDQELDNAGYGAYKSYNY